MPTSSSATATVHERLENLGPRALNDAELVAAILGPSSGANSITKAAQALLDTAPLGELAWASADQLTTVPGIGRARAAAIAAAFELGRRAGWTPPRRGDRILDPAKVYDLMRPLAYAEREEFHIILLDVRGRLMKTARISEGSLTQCPVQPRDVLREAIRIGAHGVIFVHNHPSSTEPLPSTEDLDLTERLRTATELVGVVARDHVIIGAQGYCSLVEMGRWRR